MTACFIRAVRGASSAFRNWHVCLGSKSNFQGKVCSMLLNLERLPLLRSSLYLCLLEDDGGCCRCLLDLTALWHLLLDGIWD